VLAAVYGGAGLASADVIEGPRAGEAPVRPVGWPCTQCGELNDFELRACAVCGAAFGAALRSASPAVDRKQIMIYAIAGAAAFLLLVAALTFASTKRPPAETGTSDVRTTGSVIPAQPDNVEPPAAVPAPVVPAPAAPAAPGQTLPGQTLPGQTLPGQTLPAQPAAPAAPALPQLSDPNAPVAPQ
jgi:hypothetical protein